MLKNKSFYQNKSMGLQSLLVLCALGMIGISIYLTQHYFALLSPTELSSASACNINQFFNCDKTTLSPASNLWGVPISLFGICMGVFLLNGYLFKNDETEGTHHFLAIINFMGCIALFLYSLLILKGLCPFCSIYYILSGVVFFLFLKYSDNRMPSVKWLAIYGLLAAGVAALMFFNAKEKNDTSNALKTSLMKQFDALEKLGSPSMESPFRIASATEKFEDAPLQVSIFSDFECPACKALSELMEPLSQNYKGKINIQYFFYPLDMACNPSMTRALHVYACQAAYIAACKGDQFFEVHDHLFKNQESFSPEWLEGYAKELGVTECAAKKETKEQVTKLISVGESFNVRSTPTMIVNGVKIEGVLPLNQLRMILDSLLDRAQAK